MGVGYERVPGTGALSGRGGSNALPRDMEARSRLGLGAGITDGQPDIQMSPDRYESSALAGR